MLTLTSTTNGINPALQATLTATGIGLYSFDPESNVFTVDDTCRKLFDIDPGRVCRCDRATRPGI